MKLRYLGLLFGLIPQLALAHHGSATARLSGRLEHGAERHRMHDSLRLSLTAQEVLRHFGRAQEGSAEYTRRQLGSVTLAMTQIGARLSFRSGTSVGLSVGAGWASVSPPSGAADRSFGLGDTELKLGQALPSLFHEALGLRLRAGVLFPTGRYEPETRLSVTDIAGGAAGAINVTTYNTQASLGAGSFGSSLGADFDLRLSERIHLDFGLGGQLSWTKTEDEILWGPDLTAQLGVRARLVHRLSGWVTAVLTRHFKDEVEVVDEVTGAKSREHVGGWADLAMQAGLRYGFTERFGCHVGARLPVWRWAWGVQLMETVSGMAGCGFAFGLGDG